jgi:hypothetical protein
MNLSISAIKGWSAALVLGSAALASAIYWELNADYAPRERKAQGILTTALPKVSSLPEESFSLPPLVNYTEIVERPLFNETRRPFEPEVTLPDSAKSARPVKVLRKLDWALVGVVLTPQRRSALLWSRVNNKFMRVQQGAEFEGWKLEEVLSNKVIIVNGKQRRALDLRTY